LGFLIFDYPLTHTSLVFFLTDRSYVSPEELIIAARPFGGERQRDSVQGREGETEEKRKGATVEELGGTQGVDSLGGTCKMGGIRALSKGTKGEAQKVQVIP